MAEEDEEPGDGMLALPPASVQEGAAGGQQVRNILVNWVAAH